MQDHLVLRWRVHGHAPQGVTRLIIRARRAAGVPARTAQRTSLRWGGSDGVPIIRVCLAFYIDDFVARQMRSASLGGAYICYASWPFARPTSRHAARTIAVVPPDIDSDEVLRAIKADLVAGATNGWLVYDPEGNVIRALADVSFIVRDYVQEAKSCHLMGHAAHTPCTLCTYETPNVPDSRFAKVGSSADISLMRTSARALAVAQAARAALSGECEPCSSSDS